MFLLDKNQYYKALDPLLKVSVNHLFARSVVENHVNGTIYTNSTEHPSAFHVVHPYGMSLLYGETNDCRFYESIADYMLNRNARRNKVEWMQGWPRVWNDIIGTILHDSFVDPDQAKGNNQIEVHTRANFSFNIDKYRSSRKELKSPDLRIVRTDRDIYEKMEGTVVPKNFWNNSDDFISNGVGFTLIDNNEPACTAYSAYIFDKQLELGIETLPHHRGKGYAIYTCSALIDYCILNNCEPVWSCRLQNTASYQLAQKLGFEPTVTLPYYRLPV